MKRIYACLCIVAVLLGVAFYSSWRVQKFAEDISDDIDDAMEAIRDEDLPSARQALAEGAELCDKMREGMNHLLRTQDFTELAYIIKSFRRGDISCNPYYSKYRPYVPVQTQSFKKDFIYSYFAFFVLSPIFYSVIILSCVNSHRWFQAI